MQKPEIVKYLMGLAAKSNVEKRQVGCIIIKDNKIIGEGYNSPDEADVMNNLTSNHAETAALDKAVQWSQTSGKPLTGCTVYVTHPPCPACALELTRVLGTSTKVEVIEAFMKFDGDKLRYDLLPPGPIKEIVKVLTDGARKYKPGNWMDCDDPDRYIAALQRHLELYRAGEIIDPDSGSPHLAHVATNAIFLMHLGYEPQNWLNS